MLVPLSSKKLKIRVSCEVFQRMCREFEILEWDFMKGCFKCFGRVDGWILVLCIVFEEMNGSEICMFEISGTASRKYK